MQQLHRLIGEIITRETRIANDNPLSHPVTSITADSRAVTPGAMFVAVRGTSADGHDYIDRALSAGATAVVCEQIPPGADESVAWIRVADSSVALGTLASAWYGHPSQQLKLVGVTGTNGKTTVATLLYDAVRASGRRAGLLSTVVNRIDSAEVAADHTTPDPLEINRLLSLMVEAGCSWCFMEVSSHGMAQNRVAGLRFAGGIFTNLTRDHLDYHKTMQAYLGAKKKFFDMLPRDAWALTNIDDANGKVMVQNTRARVSTYSLRTLADFHTRVIENTLGGMLLDLEGHNVSTHFTGVFNAYNLTAVYGALCLCGFDSDAAARQVSALHPVCGRFEPIAGPDGLNVIIDYAHTPDALTNVLQAINAVQPGVHITTVTGAGGNRDHGKRPLMGAEAARFSATVILTSDNPRDEDPAEIAAQMAAGIPADSKARVIIEIDRARAIARAIAEAPAGGVVLVAGKGHETYQVVEGGRTLHFDDHSEVAEALQARRDQRQ